jgi:hypothetical protein
MDHAKGIYDMNKLEQEKLIHVHTFMSHNSLLYAEDVT